MTAPAADPAADRARALVHWAALAEAAAPHPGHGVTIGLVDGPVDTGHPALAAVPSLAGSPTGCAAPGGLACRHGTAVAGLLVADPDSAAPGLCPGAALLVRPVLRETDDGGSSPAATPADLAAAIADAVDAGARVINLSLGITGGALTRSRAVDDAFDHARVRDVLVVAAAGNHGHIGPAPLLSHPWPLLVTACDGHGRPLPGANLGPRIGRTGLTAPGAGLLTCAPGGGYQRISGTSAAAPFVTAAAALLWSLAPGSTAARIRAVLVPPGPGRRSVSPPLLDAAAGLRALHGTPSGAA